MEPYERSKLSDAFKEVSVKADEFIIKEGDAGSDLFILREGEAIATKVLDEAKGPEQVMKYCAGDFFGERALIKNEPRAANVVAVSDCVLVSLDRHSVRRLLGPLETLLKRNFDIYEKFTKWSYFLYINQKRKQPLQQTLVFLSGTTIGLGVTWLFFGRATCCCSGEGSLLSEMVTLLFSRFSCSAISQITGTRDERLFKFKFRCYCELWAVS